MRNDLLGGQIDGMLLDTFYARFAVSALSGLEEAGFVEDSK